MSENYAVINGVRYNVLRVEDSDTMDVIDGVAYGYLALAVTYEVDDE